MRVVCQTLDQFLANLKSIAPTAVFQRVVYISLDRRPIDHESKYRAVKFAVVLQASTVIVAEEGGEYILECGEECGFDYQDSSQDATGTKRAEFLRETLREHCDDLGLSVRPVVVEN